MRWDIVITTIATLVISPAFAGAPQTVVLDVQNMTCSLCPITVRKSLEQVPGVSSAKIDPSRKTATVEFDPDKAAPAILVNATTNAGFPSTVHR